MSRVAAVVAWILVTLGQPLAADEPDAESRAGWAKMAEHGSGFVVWESSRTGSWRIWRRNLDGSDLRQVVPDEKDRDHFCPHISPDGKRLIYLSYPAGRSEYVNDQPTQGITLHIIGTDGLSNQMLVPAARAYGGDRAVVWFDNQRFAYIDGDGITQQFDLASRQSRRLTTERQGQSGFLVNATKTFATSGEPTFSPFDSKQLQITPQARQGGCEPYFTHNGRWGFWMGGAGGPINRFDLQTRQISPIINKDDSRMPKGRQYLYFPMVSRNGRLLTFAASPDQHDHVKSDYDVFVARLNPETLEIIDRPVRYSFDPATDRYPDVYVADLELGRFAGEVPLSVYFASPLSENEWAWDFGDGVTANGAIAKHTFEEPGEYRVSARLKDRTLFGLVHVTPAAPPKPISVALSKPNEIIVVFDEPIQLKNASARLEAGPKIVASAVSKNGLQLTITLAEKLARADVLHLTGIADQAARPNVMSPQKLSISPASWPVHREGLVYLFQTSDKSNQVAGPGGKLRSYAIHPRGRARWNHDHALVLTGGSFGVEGVDEHLLDSCRHSQQLTVEAVITPDHVHQTGPARIVTFSSSALSRNFTLGQEGEKLIFRLRTPSTGENGVNPESTLAAIAERKPVHVAVTYRPGELVAYLDGKEVHRGNNIQGDFSNWSPHHLVFGDESNGERNWEGTLEGVAIYNRWLERDEVQRNADEYHRLIKSRTAVPQIEVSAKLLAKSPVPTLDEVKPYRGALMVCKYRVTQVLRGKLEDKEVLITQWALLDGQPQPVAALEPGAEVRLILELGESNPHLQRFVCKDRFDSDADLLLSRYYDATP